MYLLDERPSAPPTRADAPELDWLRQLAERSYWEHFTMSPEALAERAIEALGGLHSLGSFHSGEPTLALEELQIGVACSAGPEKKLCFDRATRYALSWMDFKLVGRRGMKERVLGWESIEESAQKASARKFGYSESISVTYKPSMLSERVKFKGALSVAPDPQSISGMSLEFTPNRRIKDVHPSVFDDFSQIFAAQNFRNRLAWSHSQLPEAQPLSLSIFMGIFEVLHRAEPELLGGPEDDIHKDLTDLLLGKRLAYTPARLKRYGPTSTTGQRAKLDIGLNSCRLCGSLVQLRTYYSEREMDDVHTINSLLSDDHAATGCDGPSQVAEKTRTA